MFYHQRSSHAHDPLFFMEQIFNGIRESNVKVLQKLVLISGDVSVDGLEMSTVDEKNLINDVNVIFHCAGNVRFNDKLKIAVNNNVLGIRRVLQLAEKMKHLEVFSHMSTCSCQSYQQDLEERYYPSKVDVLDIIENTQLMTDEELDNLEKDL